MAKRKVAGRPPAGEGGALVSKDYRRLTLRIPPGRVRQLQRLSLLLGVNQAGVVLRALDALLETLPPEDRRVVNRANKGA